MDIEYFQVLEEKVNQLINRVVSLRNENSEIAEANSHLEEKVQGLMIEMDRLREENKSLSEKAEQTTNNGAQEAEIKNRLEEILRKVDEVVKA